MIRRPLILAAALFMSLSGAAYAEGDWQIPSDAVVTKMPSVVDVTFHDGSTFKQVRENISVEGPQAVAWFLANTDDKNLRLIKPADLKSWTFSKAGANAVEKSVFADGSTITTMPNVFEVKAGMASHYMHIIDEANKATHK